MKTKILVVAALVGIAAVSANAGVQCNISIGFPAPVIVSGPVVVVATPAPPPPPVVVVRTPPSCPPRGCDWRPGYWAHRPVNYACAGGGWNRRPEWNEHGHYSDAYRH